jgi:single-strand DNA-binding protein
MSINKVILVGNVGRDPQVRYFEKGGGVANFSLATTERGYTTQSGTVVADRTEWHNIVFWGKIVETVEKYVHKGDKIYVEGRLRSRSYEDQNGVRHNVVEIYADTLEIMSRVSAGGGDRASGADIPDDATSDDLK